MPLNFIVVLTIVIACTLHLPALVTAAAAAAAAGCSAWLRSFSG
jgi:hypothetical protein